MVFKGIVGGVDNTKIRLYTKLEKSTETVLEFYKETAKSVMTIYEWLNTIK